MAHPSMCERIGAPSPLEDLPFAKVVALDFADVLTAGVVRCASCPIAYRFETLAIDVDGAIDRAAWDRGEELRVFGLAQLPAGTFERIVDLLSPLGKPTWPIWAPGTGGHSPSIPAAIDRELTLLLNVAGPPTLVVAASGLLARPRVTLPAPAGSDWLRRDWGWFLGLVVGKSDKQPA